MKDRIYVLSIVQKLSILVREKKIVLKCGAKSLVENFKNNVENSIKKCCLVKVWVAHRLKLHGKIKILMIPMPWWSCRVFFFLPNQLKNWNYVQILDNWQYRSVIHKRGEKKRGSSLFGPDFKVESLFGHAARGTQAEP